MGELDLVTCLTITTKSRKAFRPWVLWNFYKQTWPHKQLIVITDGGNWPQDVIVHKAWGNIPNKRNIALSATLGGLTTWFDDDDWQHPQKLEMIAQNTRRGTIFGCDHSAFIDISTMKGQRYGGAMPIFNSLGFHTDDAGEFDEKMDKASDTKWMMRLRKKTGRIITPVPLFYWLVHTTNTSNPADIVNAQQNLFYDFNEDTWQQLKRLKLRLKPT